jgi:hypothetical protein
MSFLSTDAYILARTQGLAHWVQRTYGMTNFRLAQWCLYLMLLGCGTCLLYSYHTAPPQSASDAVPLILMALIVFLPTPRLLLMLRQEDDRSRNMPYRNWRTGDEYQMYYRLFATGTTLWVAILLPFFPSLGLGVALCFGAGLSCAAYLGAGTPQRT